MPAFVKDDAYAIGRRVADALERAGIPHALGGALAYGAWAVGRGTHDVDVNVFVELAALGPVFDALKQAGAELDDPRARTQAETDGMFEARIDGMRIDVFVPSIDFSWEAARTRVRIDDEGRPVWVLSAEALAVFKLLFFRGKDVVDLERLVATQGTRLDTAYVRAWIARMMGDDDERVRAWDRLVAEFGGAP